ncbi:MAG: uracil-DNA glycosylase [Spirochaetaceae bacterium]|jgi:DNA polymerase|nr:uracil-DNA glycosylase [Spirochaetaceae bacterium]
MTAEQKLSAARFLDTAGAFLKTGYFDECEPYNFTDDEELPVNAAAYSAVKSVAETVAVYCGEAEYCADSEIPGLNKDAGNAEAPDSIKSIKPTDSIKSIDSIKTTDSIAAIADAVCKCTNCGLHTTRIKAVPGEGVENPLVLVVGEGPGADEDASGRPFVGAAGRLLDKMLLAIGLDRKKNCFIANVIKCRPPQNRDPYPDEAAACLPFFEQQLAALNPPLILTVGKIPVKALLGTDEGITRLRGNWKLYHGIPLLPTFHPSYLLRDASQKRFAWEDLKALCRRLAEIDSAYAAETAQIRAGWNS